MGKNLKKALALFFAVIMLVSVVPVNVSAEDAVSGKCGRGVTWSYDSGTETLTISGTGEMENYGNGAAFSADYTEYYTLAPWRPYLKAIKNVVIMSGITSIGGCAFYGCSALTNATISDTVTFIDANAFDRCSALASINIPASVRIMGPFNGCDSLSNIIVDNNNSVYHSSGNCVIETESKTLIAGCKNSIIPDDGSVTRIGNDAFKICNGLTDIIIPSSIKRVGIDVFVGCSDLVKITVNNNNEVYHSAGNCLIETKSKTLIAGCRNSVIPGDGSVTSIGEDAFLGCEGLESITIPENVTDIGNFSFCLCTGMTSISIPKSVTRIGNSAFYSCPALTDVYYQGTKREWNAIKIEEYNHWLTNANVHFSGGDGILGVFTLIRDFFANLIAIFRNIFNLSQ